jgi:hypothetical protein
MNKFRSTKGLFFFIFLFLLGILIITFPVRAEKSGVIKVGPTVVMRLVDDGVSNPVTRAEIIQQRIDALLKQGNLAPDDVKVRKNQAGFGVYWGQELIITVDFHQAKANRSKPEELAEVWAGNLRKAIREYAFYLVPNQVEMPVNGTIRVATAGQVTGNIFLEAEEGTGGFDVSQDGESLILKAPSTPGRTSLVLSRGGSRTRLFIHVKELAGSIPVKIETSVAGERVPSQVLVRASENAIRNYVRVKPGAVLTITGSIRTESFLNKGKQTRALVPVIIEGTGYFPVSVEVPVLINNTGENMLPMKKLMVSDRPEAFNQDGILFTSSFTRQEPTRLLFYHLNASRTARDLWVEIENPTAEPVTLRMIEGWAGPDKYGIIVGHQAVLRFLDLYNNKVSYTINIPARNRTTIFQSRMPAHFVLAGYINLQIEKGNELKISVKNSTNKELNGRNLPILHQPFDPFRIHPKGVFVPADIEDDIEFHVGQDEEASGFIGKAPWLIDAVTGEPNNGNYGVFYKFNVKLSNPTNKKQRVGFYFVPEGRRAQGTFLIDGKLYETGLVIKPDRKLFMVDDLKPGEKKELNIVSTPQGGSYYPVKLVIEPVGPNVVPKKPDDPDPKILPDDDEIYEEI